MTTLAPLAEVSGNYIIWTIVGVLAIVALILYIRRGT